MTRNLNTPVRHQSATKVENYDENSTNMAVTNQQLKK